MKNPINLLYLFLIIGVVGFISSCDEDDPVAPADPLNAKAGPNQEAEVNETVTLDGSESTGPAGFTYFWSYEGHVPEADINFQDINTANPTFIPPTPGLYEFTLTISQGDSSDVDETTVLVGGAVELGGTLTQDLELKNIQSDGNLPDYIVISDLVVPDGLTLSIVEDDVIIEFNSETGIHVQEGGTFTNVDVDENYGFTTELFGDSGWKGILIEGGTLNLERTIIMNAGATAFDGQAEAAAISFVGSLSTLESLTDNEFVNSNSYDILALDRVAGSAFPVKNNRLSYTIPIKSQIRFMELWTSDEPNIMPDDYDYIQLIPRGSNLKDETNNNNGFEFYPRGTKFYIDGDFWAGSRVSIGENSIIYMKENSGILFEETWNSNPGSIIKGMDGKNWKGIAAANNSGRFKIDESTIENAGYGRHIIGGALAKADASIYWSGTGNSSSNEINSSTIKNGGGYGYYDATSDITNTRILNSIFQDIDSAAIKTNVRSVGIIIPIENHGNTFNLQPGVAAVYVNGDGAARDTWYALGTGNYYLIDADFIPSSWGLTIESGVHLKFKSERFFNWNPLNMDLGLEIKGTAENPVVIEGEEDNPGSWGGAYLRGLYIVKHAKFINGGGFPLADDLGTETGNVVTAFNGTQEQLALLDNCTFENSAGYGLIKAPISIDYMWEDPKWNNTFTNNANGDVLKLN